MLFILVLVSFFKISYYLLGIREATLSYSICKCSLPAYKEIHLSLSMLYAEYASLLTPYLPSVITVHTHMMDHWCVPGLGLGSHAYHALSGTCGPASPRHEEAEHSSQGLQGCLEPKLKDLPGRRQQCG